MISCTYSDAFLMTIFSFKPVFFAWISEYVARFCDLKSKIRAQVTMLEEKVTETKAMY